MENIFFSRQKLILIFLISTLLLTYVLTNSSPNVSEDSEIKIDETVLEGMVNAIKIRNYDSEMNALKNTTDLTYLVYYYKRSSQNSLFGGYYLNKIDRKLDYLAMILLVDCDLVIPRNISHCKSSDNALPKIKLLVPPIYRFDSQTKKMNHHVEVDFSEDTVSEQSILKFITQNIPAFSTQLTQETIEPFLSQPLFSKIILFTDKQTTPNVYKGLTNLFYDRILFGEVQSTNTEFTQKFNITKFPTILAVQNPFLLKDNYVITRYERANTAAEIAEFIETYALRDKNYVKRLADMKIEKNPFNKLTIDNFENFFDTSNFNELPKIVYFTDEESNESNVSKIPQDIQRFALQTSGYFNFGVFNCKNNKQFCKSEFYVDVDKLPSLYLFNPKNDYTQMMKNNRLLPNTFNKLLVYFANRITGNVKRINDDEEVYHIISEDRNIGKYPIIYIHKNETKVNMPLRLISSIPEYLEKIAFYNLDNPSDELLELFQMKYKEPFTVVFIHDKLREDSFRIHKLEDSFKNNYIGFKTFIETIIGDYVFPIKQNDFAFRKSLSLIKKFEPLEEASKFYKQCIYSNQLCAIAFLNGDFDKEINRINLDFKKHLKTLDGLTKDYNLNTGLYYVNATCYEELSAAFKVGLSQMPTVVVIDPVSKLYAKMNANENFEDSDLKHFISEAVQKKVFFRKYEIDDVVFKERYCQEKTDKSKDVNYDKLDRVKRGLEDDDEEEEENNIKKDL